MTFAEVKALDKKATADGLVVTDYRPYSYLHENVTRYMLIIQDSPDGHEVACMSQANYSIGRFTGIFD